MAVFFTLECKVLAAEPREGIQNRLLPIPLAGFAGKRHTLNGPFPSCIEPRYESEAKCKAFIMKISFHSYANKTNFHMKSCALGLAFIMRYTATWKWPIDFIKTDWVFFVCLFLFCFLF